jgi:hypothetical protein
MLDADPNEAVAVPAPLDTGFDTTPVTATVSPALAPAPATVETGFDHLGGTPAPVQQAAPTVNTVADTGEPEDQTPTVVLRGTVSEDQPAGDIAANAAPETGVNGVA